MKRTLTGAYFDQDVGFISVSCATAGREANTPIFPKVIVDGQNRKSEIQSFGPQTQAQEGCKGKDPDQGEVRGLPMRDDKSPELVQS